MNKNFFLEKIFRYSFPCKNFFPIPFEAQKNCREYTLLDINCLLTDGEDSGKSLDQLFEDHQGYCRMAALQNLVRTHPTRLIKEQRLSHPGSQPILFRVPRGTLCKFISKDA